MLVLSVVALLAPVLPVGFVAADDAVVGGACDDTEFNSALAAAQSNGGGTITFDCGGPATILFGAVKTISASNSVIIDGGGQITLSGATAVQLFDVESGATLELRDITLTDGQAGLGGAIANAGTLRIVNSTLTENEADGAGAVYNEGDATITDSVLSSNVAQNAGVILNVGTLEITGSVFFENTGTAAFAGGILNGGTATITDTTFELNSSFFGGAITNTENAVLDLFGSTFVENAATGTGAGIYNDDGFVTITNSTFSGNSSPLGPAVFSTDGVTEIIASTVTDNSSESGSLDNDQGGTIILRQTIVADQNSGADCDGSMTSDDYNLDSDGTCNLTALHDITNGDPELGPLVDNGGETLTHMPAQSSVAVDSGGFSCPSVDQRGKPRPAGAGCDIGAVELQTAATYALCADYYTGRVMSPFNGQCGTRQFELDVPESYPLAFCIDAYTGVVGYTFGRPCNPPRQIHLMPDDGDLLTCVSYYTSLNRRVYNHSQCRPNEIPNFIPAAL
ncbi:MAG: right-handed parallel beta-helix repeat-containing protein [Thermomicrobiales bacterium]